MARAQALVGDLRVSALGDSQNAAMTNFEGRVAARMPGTENAIFFSSVSLVV